jgi:transmembrane 9 superfamily protein 2/4
MKLSTVLPQFMRKTVVLTVILQFLCDIGNAFYVPGVAPQDFKENDKIDVRAIKMTSSHTQLPYEYYSLPFCKPSGNIVYKSQVC